MIMDSTCSEVILEKWQEEQYQEFFAASNDEQLYANMSGTFPKTIEECEAAVKVYASSTDKTEYIRAIKVDNQIVGCIAAFFETGMYCKNAELAYWIGKEYRGKGIMAQAVQCMADELFSVFGIHRIWARPFAHNVGSRRVLEKCGFVYEGLFKEDVYKNGEFIDSVVYALLK